MTYVDSEILFDLNTTQQQLFLKKAYNIEFINPTYAPGEIFDYLFGTRDTADYYEVYFIKEHGCELNIEEDVYYYNFNLIERIADIIESHISWWSADSLIFATDDLSLVGDFIEQVVDDIVSKVNFIKIEHLPAGIKTEGYETE